MRDLLLRKQERLVVQLKALAAAAPAGRLAATGTKFGELERRLRAKAGSLEDVDAQRRFVAELPTAMAPLVAEVEATQVGDWERRARAHAQTLDTAARCGSRSPRARALCPSTPAARAHAATLPPRALPPRSRGTTRWSACATCCPTTRRATSWPARPGR